MYRILIQEAESPMPDYPDIDFLNVPAMHRNEAEALATILNKFVDVQRHNRWYKAVRADYELQTYGCDF
jgi:hypothetical protein